MFNRLGASGFKDGGKLHSAVALTALERVNIRNFQGPSAPLISRDAFVSETAIKVEQVQRELRALAGDLAAMQAAIDVLREDTDRNYRFSTFQEKEQRAKYGVVEDILRRLGDLKKRLDAIDGKTDGNYHSYNNFEAVSRRLTELGEIERNFRDVTLKLKLSAGFFCASILLWLFTLLTGLV